MSFNIDLNDTPLALPHEQQQLNLIACSICREEVPAGWRVNLVVDEHRKVFKCLKCLLKSSGGNNRDRDFVIDLNSSPMREIDGAGRIGGRHCGNSTDYSSSSFHLPYKHGQKRKNMTPVLPYPPTCPSTSISGMGSPAQSITGPLYNALPLSSPSQIIMPFSDTPMRKVRPNSSKGNITPGHNFYNTRDDESTKSLIPSSNATCPRSVSPPLRSICQAIESGYDSKEYYQILASELASKVKKLEHELELSEAKRAKSERLTSSLKEAVKNLVKTLESTKSDANVLDKFIKEADDASS